MIKTGQALGAVSVSLLLVVVPAGCATNPATGDRMFSLISERQEIEMGRAYAEQIGATMPRYDDPDLQAYVEQIGQRLAATSERPHLPWSFTVLDDAAVNAFAVPGGHLYVTRGILTHFNSEAELAAVLGHEVGHVTARHSVEQLSRQQLLGGLLGVGSIFSEDVRRMSGFGAAAIGILGLRHSRDDEHQADSLGVRYALNEQYDPREAIKVHTMLGRHTELRSGRGVPNWLATHPSSADRIERIREQVEAIPAATLAPTRVLADEYLASLDGVVFGLDPRDGFFQGPRFLHPDLAFEFTMPDGWETGVWSWNQSEIMATAANTLAELVAEVPGMIVLVGGDYGTPAALSAFGTGGGGVRIFRDGFELPPLGGGVADLARIAHRQRTCGRKKRFEPRIVPKRVGVLWTHLGMLPSSWNQQAWPEEGSGLRKRTLRRRLSA